MKNRMSFFQEITEEFERAEKKNCARLEAVSEKGFWAQTKAIVQNSTEDYFRPITVCTRVIKRRLGLGVE